LESQEDIYSLKDMLDYGLIGKNNSSKKRKELGDILNIGYCSGKKFLKRINSFKINRKLLEKSLVNIERRYMNE